jgi:hypothetical protein
MADRSLSLIHLALAPAVPSSQEGEGTPGHVLVPADLCPIMVSHR